MLLSSKKPQETEVLERIVEKLNKKFDPNDLYYHTRQTPMFKGIYLTKGDISSWSIMFIDEMVFNGCDTTNNKYIPLYEENETKVYMMAVSKTISVIKDMVTLISIMDVSNTNKTEWINILKNSNTEEEDAD